MMEPIEIVLATTLIAKVTDELIAKSNNKYIKKYIGLFSWIAKLYAGKK